MKSLPGLVVSRPDRLGDLVLSLPALAHLRDLGFRVEALHVSAYAEDVGEWALLNDICEFVWPEGAPCPLPRKGERWGLSLFHSRTSARALRAAGVARSFAPRSKLSTLWSYSRTLPQHRSRVEMSEARYNLELAAWVAREAGLEPAPFRGLPALRVPEAWRAETATELGDARLADARTVIVVSNAGSAANWPLERYLELAQARLGEGFDVDFLVSGNDAETRARAIEAWQPVGHRRPRLVGNFARVRRLIAYLASAREVVSSSTGPLHIAHAAGVPVFGVYPLRPLVQTFARWRPDGYLHEGGVRYAEFDPDAPAS